MDYIKVDIIIGGKQTYVLLREWGEGKIGKGGHHVSHYTVPKVEVFRASHISVSEK